MFYGFPDLTPSEDFTFFLNRGAESLADDDETIGSEISLLSVVVKALLTVRPDFKPGKILIKSLSRK